MTGLLRQIDGFLRKFFRPSAMQTRKEKGYAGERLAARYLRRQGLKILERNYRYNRGEIDLIAEDRGEIVFVEVKTRHSLRMGAPEDAVTPQKREQIRMVARGYLHAHRKDNAPCRFDVVAITHQSGDTSIEYMKNAF